MLKGAPFKAGVKPMSTWSPAAVNSKALPPRTDCVVKPAVPRSVPSFSYGVSSSAFC